MAIHVVENCDGRAQINWSGLGILFVSLFVASGLIPAIGMGLLLSSEKSAGMALAIGFSMSCCTLPILVLQQLSLPIDQLPVGN
jgi:hypothetical protein